MKECGFIIIPKSTGDEPKPKDAKGGKGAKDDKKDKPAEGEKKEEAAVVKFDDQDFLNCIAPSYSFDEDYMGYVDFLEALVRVAMAFPFTDE